MTDGVDKIALIEEYLKGNLSGQTLADFEAEIAADSVLASEIAVQKEIYQGIDRLGDKGLMTELDQYHNDYVSQSPKFSKRKKKAFFYSLGAVLLVFVSLYTFTHMGGNKVRGGKKETPNNNMEDSSSLIINTQDTTEFSPIIDSSSTEVNTNIDVAPLQRENELVEIKKFTNPIVLGKTSNKTEYVYSFGELKLYGADHLDLNRLEIIRHKNEILLYDQKYYCVLEETHKRKPLVVDPNIKIYNTYIKPSKKSPKMKIIKTNIELKEEIEFTSIRVIKKDGLKGNKYKYNGVTIEITEDLYKILGDKFQLIQVDKMDHAVIKSENGLFHLEKGTKDFVEIIKIHDPEIKNLFNTEERLIPLKTETIEGFGDGHHPGQ